jgi:hypothetical protein
VDDLDHDAALQRRQVGIDAEGSEFILAGESGAGLVGGAHDAVPEALKGCDHAARGEWPWGCEDGALGQVEREVTHAELGNAALDEQLSCSCPYAVPWIDAQEYRDVLWCWDSTRAGGPLVDLTALHVAAEHQPACFPGHWADTPTFLAILGWVERARATAEAAHTSACQRDRHRTFDTYRLAMTDALEQARGTARLLLDHLGPHLDQPPAGLPGWVYDRDGDDPRPERPAGA